MPTRIPDLVAALTLISTLPHIFFIYTCHVCSCHHRRHNLVAAQALQHFHFELSSSHLHTILFMSTTLQDPPKQPTTFQVHTLHHTPSPQHPWSTHTSSHTTFESLFQEVSPTSKFFTISARMYQPKLSYLLMPSQEISLTSRSNTYSSFPRYILFTHLQTNIFTSHYKTSQATHSIHPPTSQPISFKINDPSTHGPHTHLTSHNYMKKNLNSTSSQFGHKCIKPKLPYLLIPSQET